MITSDKYIPGGGPLGAKLLILGEAPAKYEIELGKPFVGPSGKELDSLLKESGINRNECWITNVVKYEVIPNQKGKKIPFETRCKISGIDIDEQLKELQNEITSIKPNCILALGGTALWALKGTKAIKNFRGSILHGMGTKFIPTYHPAHLLHQSSSAEFKGYWNRNVMLFDFMRAKVQSRFPEYILPKRTLEVARNSMHLAQFLNQYKYCTKAAIDIEARGMCIPVCIGIAFNKRHGLTVPLWNEDNYCTIPDSDLVQCWILLAEFLSRIDIIGQNFAYDRDKIIRLGFKTKNPISDIMLKALAINPELPKNLAFNQSIYTEEPFYKDEGMYEGSINDLFLGCSRDACVTYEIDENMDADLDTLGQRDFYQNFLMYLHELYLSIQNQGFAVDKFERDRLLAKYIKWDEKTRYELFKLTGTEINTSSPQQIASLLWNNWKLPKKESTGEEDLAELLNSPSVKDEIHRKGLELILENRRVRKSISTYLMALADYDSRMKTTYFPCLDTGRTSTSPQDPPIRPEIQIIDENGKKKDKVIGIAFQTMTKHGDIGADIRGMYIPDSEEEIFVQADSSQAEARVVWLLADDEEALTLVDTCDYHALTASWFFGGTENDYSKKVLGYEHPIRFCGKTLRHAGHLGAGKHRASISVNTDARKFKIPITITEAQAGHALDTFHYKQPKIRKVFQAGIVECLKKDRRLIAGLPYGIQSSVGGQRIFYERWGEDLFRQAYSYIPQRTVSDNTKAAALRIRERIPGIKIVMESHDALLFCIRQSILQPFCNIIKEEMERPISFETCSLKRRELVIPCEIEVGMNYRDLSKFRFKIAA